MIFTDHCHNLINQLYIDYPHILNYNILKERKEKNEQDKNEIKKQKKEDNLIEKKRLLKEEIKNNIRKDINFIQGRDEIAPPNDGEIYTLDIAINKITFLNKTEKGKV